MSVTPYASPAPTTPWVPLWPLGGQTMGELAYAERASALSITPTTEASAAAYLDAPAVQCDGATPIIVEVFSPYAAPPAANGIALYAWLFDNGVSLGQIAVIAAASATGAGGPLYGRRRLTPSAGSHVFSWRGSITSGASPGSFQGGAGVPGGYVPAHIRISLASPISNAPAGALLPVQYATTLPVGPVDGQEAILVNSLTAADFIWRFRYNALATGPNKWEFVGGAPYALPPVGSTAIATSYTTVGAGFTVPRSGDYLVTVGGQFGAGTLANAAVSVSGGEASKLVAIGWVGTGSGAPWLSGTATYSYNVGDALLFRVNSSVAMNLVRGAYTITPLRVA